MMALASGWSEVTLPLVQSHLYLIIDGSLMAQVPDRWISTRRRRSPSINGFTERRSQGARRFFQKVRRFGVILILVAG